MSFQDQLSDLRNAAKCTRRQLCTTVSNINKLIMMF